MTTTTASRPVRAYLTVEAARPGDPVSHPKPAISWRFEAAEATWRQHTAELRWESAGLVVVAHHQSEERLRVEWPFAPLSARQRGNLRVRVAGKDGVFGDWSNPVSVIAGFLGEDEWNAEWIGHPMPERHAQPTLLRYTFKVSEVVRATLYATAVGSYQAAVNGTDVDDHVLKPGWTPFDKRTVYDTADVTALVHDGKNTLVFRLAGTWATERFGFRQNARPQYGDQPRLAAQLFLELANGETRWIGSGAAWQAADAPITASSLYEGEHHDARLANPKRWSPARVFESNATPGPRISPPVRRIEQRPVATILPSPPGTLLLDFGQNLVGRLRIRVSGPRGSTVTLRHAEVLEDSRLGTRPLRRAISTDSYTLAGTGVEVWEPEFTFHGFRYAEITGWPGEFDPADVSAVVIHSDMTRTGWFQTSHPLLQRLHDNVVWSLRSNFLSIPTDCPQRDERLGWTGDIQVFAPTAGFLYDVRSFLDSWLRDLLLEQQADGTVPFVVPDVLGLSRPAAAWGDAAVVVPDVLERLYGDRDILERQYPSARAWVELCLRRAASRHVWEGDFQFGDWLDPTAPPDHPGQAMTAPGLVATAYLARSTELLARAAAALGKCEDAQRYRTACGDVRAAFVDEYVTAAGRMVSDTPTAYALGLVFGLIPEDSRSAAGARLADLVRENGYRIATGFVGTPLILDALTATGHDNEAARLLLETGCPSWLYPVTMGATTIWERWNSMLPDGSINPGNMTSFNHYALGAVADWMHRELGGLTVLEPGARRVRIAPRPLPGVDDAAVALESSSGRIEVEWQRQGDEVRIRATIPNGVDAEAPGSDGQRILSAGVHIWTVPSRTPEPLGRVGLESSLAEIIDDPDALSVVEETLAEHNPASVNAMRAATRWTKGQTLAEIVFQYASPEVQREIGRRLTVLSDSRDSVNL